MSGYNLGTSSGRIIVDGSGAQKGFAVAKAAADKFFDSVNNRADEIKDFGAKLTAGSAAGVAGFGLAVNAASKFETRLSAIKAVSGATTSEMDKIGEAALQIGAQTSFGATDAASAFEELIKAGISTKDALDGAASATVSMAEAGEIALPRAAEIASAAMNNFHMSAKDMPKVADLVAGAANASAIGVEDFAQSMNQTGAVANLVGLSFEDMSVAIAEMGNAGIKGSDAGTSLKTMLMNLQPQTKKQINLSKELGLLTFDVSKGYKNLSDKGLKPLDKTYAGVYNAAEKYLIKTEGLKAGTKTLKTATEEYLMKNGAMQNAFFTSEGKIKNLADIQDVLGKSLKGMSEEQKVAALETLFGADSIRAAAIMADNGAKGYDKMSQAMKGVTSADVAKTRMDNLSGAIEEFKGAVETIAIKIGRVFIPALTDIIVGITGVLTWISNLSDGFFKWATTVAAAGTALGGFIGLLVMAVSHLGPLLLILVGLKKLFNVFKLLQGAAQAFMALSAGAGLFARTGAALVFLFKNIASAVIPFWGLISKLRFAFLLLTGPVGITIGIVSALVAAFIWAYKNIEWFRNGVNGAWTGIKTAAAAFVDWITGSFVPWIVNAWKNIVAGAQAIGPFFVQLWNNIKNTVSTTWNAIISFITTTVGAIVSFLMGAWNGFVAVNVAVWTAILTTITTVWNNIVTTLTTGFEILKMLFTLGWQIITTAFSAAFTVIGTIVSAGWQIIQTIFSTAWEVIKVLVAAAFLTIVALFTGNFSQIGVIAAAAWAKLGQIFSGALTTIKTIVSTAWTTIKTVIITALMTIMSRVAAGIGIIKTVWNAGWSAISNFVKTAWANIKAAVVAGAAAILVRVISAIMNIRARWIAGWAAIGAALSNAWANIKATAARGVASLIVGIIGFISRARSTWINGWAAIGNFFRTVWSNLQSSAANGFAKLVAFFVSFPGKAKGALSSLPGQMLSIGRNIVQGLINGVKNMASGAVNALKNIASNMISAAKGVLGIHSPSREMIKVGKYITDGLTIGINTTAKSAIDAMKKLAAKLIDVTMANAEKRKKLEDAVAKAARNANVKNNDSYIKSIKSAEKRVSKYRAAVNKNNTKSNRRALANAQASLKTAQKNRTASIKKASGKDKAAYAKALKDLKAFNKKNGTLTVAQAKKQAAKLLAQTKTKKKSTDKDKTVADFVKAREKNVAALKKVNDDLKKQVDARNQLRDSVRSSLVGEFKLGDLASAAEQTGQKIKFDDVKKYAQGVLSKVSSFQGKLSKLAKAGVHPALIQEVAGLGSTQGAMVADAMLQGTRSQIAGLSSIYNKLDKAALAAGNTVAGSMYNVGINAVKGLAAGLEDKNKIIDKAISKLVAKTTTQTKKGFQVHSPSRLFENEIGVQLPAGIGKGIENGLPALLKTMDSMVQVPGLPQLGMGSLGLRDGVVAAPAAPVQDLRPINLTIEGVDVNNAEAVAGTIMTTLKRYQRQGSAYAGSRG